MKTTAKSLLSALLILLFVYAAVSKLLDPDEFRAQLYRQPFSHGFADLLLYSLPASELLAAALLGFDRTRLTGLFLSLGLLLSFTIYISLGLLHYWAAVPCSCGGILRHMGWGAHLVFNLVFTGVNLTAIFLSRQRPTGEAENL
jgi:hypothetical protein